MAARAEDARTHRALAAISTTAVAVAGLTALAALIRVWGLGRQSYWYDEALTVDLIRMPFGDMLHGVRAHEATPPLYFVLAWIWTRVFGDAEAGLRSLSAVIGTATVPVAYLAARELVSRRAGLIAAALVAVSPALVWYSQEGRSYALFTFTSALSLLFFARAWRRGTPASFAGWAIASAVALVTHYFSLFLIVPEAVWLVARSRNRRAALLACAGLGVAGAAIAPLALYQRVHGGADWIGTLPLHDRASRAAHFLVGGYGGAGATALVLNGLLLAGALVLALRSEDRTLRSGALAALALGLAAIAVPFAGAAVGSDYVLDRNLLTAFLPLAIVIGAGLATRRVGASGLVVAVLACLLMLRFDYRIAISHTRERDDWRSVAQALGPPRSDRVVVVAPRWQALPLRVYRPGMSGLSTPRAAAEVDEIAYTGQLPGNAHPVPPSPGPGFRPVGVARIQRMTLARFRADRPTRVDPRALSDGTSSPYAER